MIDPDAQPLDLINCALEHSPMSIRFIPFAGLVKKTIIHRRSPAPGQRRGPEYGRIIADVPAAVARTLQGAKDQMDVLILVHIDRAVYERAKSGIVLPTGLW